MARAREHANHTLRGEVREEAGCKRTSGAAIVDGHAVKTAEDGDAMRMMVASIVIGGSGIRQSMSCG